MPQSKLLARLPLALGSTSARNEVGVYVSEHRRLVRFDPVIGPLPAVAGGIGILPVVLFLVLWQVLWCSCAGRYCGALTGWKPIPLCRRNPVRRFLRLRGW